VSHAALLRAAEQDAPPETLGWLAIDTRVVGRGDDAHPAVAEFGEGRIRAERAAWGEGMVEEVDYSADPGTSTGIEPMG